MNIFAQTPPWTPPPLLRIARLGVFEIILGQSRPTRSHAKSNRWGNPQACFCLAGHLLNAPPLRTPPKKPLIRGQKINANFFCTKFFKNPSGHGRPRQKSWTSAPKSAFFCGPGDGEKLFDPGSSGRKGRECPREIRAEKFMFILP